MADIDIDDILHILPHRYPFLLVDRILEFEEKRIVGIKNVTVNEPCFQGHFPGRPVMPGVLQLEAMAQVAGIMLNKTHGREGGIAYFSAIDKVKFRRLVRPGDVMRMEVTFVKMKLNIAKVHAVTTVDGETVSQGDLTFSIEKE